MGRAHYLESAEWSDHDVGTGDHPLFERMGSFRNSSPSPSQGNRSLLALFDSSNDVIPSFIFDSESVGLTPYKNRATLPLQKLVVSFSCLSYLYPAYTYLHISNDPIGAFLFLLISASTAICEGNWTTHTYAHLANQTLAVVCVLYTLVPKIWPLCTVTVMAQMMVGTCLTVLLLVEASLAQNSWRWVLMISGWHVASAWWVGLACYCLPDGEGCPLRTAHDIILNMVLE